MTIQSEDNCNCRHYFIKYFRELYLLIILLLNDPFKLNDFNNYFFIIDLEFQKYKNIIFKDCSFLGRQIKHLKLNLTIFKRQII